MQVTSSTPPAPAVSGVQQRGRPRYLTEDQMRFYAEKGYLVIENVLSPQALHELRAASEQLQEARRQLGGETRLAVIHNVTLMHEAFMKTSRHPTMLAVVTDLIGENLRLQHVKLNWKPPAAGTGEVGWHQDLAEYPTLILSAA